MGARAVSIEPDWTQRRRCLYCGHDGPLLQAGAGRSAFRCPRCAGDLYARPPRSYRELEGLEPAAGNSASGAHQRPGWLARAGTAVWSVLGVAALGAMWCCWTLRRRWGHAAAWRPPAVRHARGRARPAREEERGGEVDRIRP